jgi:hypothetical protein
MQLEDFVFGLFTVCNGLGILAYLPQLRKVAIDPNGASAISYTSWLMFLSASLSTLAYALVNRADWGLAGSAACNALCCACVIGLTFCKRRRHAASLPPRGVQPYAAADLGTGGPAFPPTPVPPRTGAGVETGNSR